MDLRQLRYFVAVAEERHITRAAERLGLQQPPLSQTMAALERELGGALFTRLPRGVELTDAGVVLLAEARDIIARFERAAALTKRVLDGRTGRLSVGFTTSAILHPVVASIIRAYRDEAVGVELDLHEGNAADLTERLQRGELAAAFLRVPVARPEGIAFQRLLDEALILALPPGHPLLKLAGQRAVNLSELAQERFILVRRPRAPGMYANLLSACRDAGFEPIIAAEVGHMLTNINLVAAGLGISLVPASMRDFNQRQVGYMAVTPAEGLAAPLTLAYVARGSSLVLRRFIAISREIADREQAVA